MRKDENRIWEALIEETKASVMWILGAEKSDEGGPLFAVTLMLSKTLVKESEWLQAIASEGRTKSKDPVDAKILQERLKRMQTAVKRHEDIQWRNRIYVPAALMNLIRVLEVTNMYTRVAIERAVSTAHTTAKK